MKLIDAGKESAMEAEMKAARERAIIPLEIRMKQFRDMLTEKEVYNNLTKYCCVQGMFLITHSCFYYFDIAVVN